MIVEWLVVVAAAVIAALGTHRVIGKLSLALGGKRRRPAIEASGTGTVFVLVLLGGYLVLTGEPMELETSVSAPSVEPETVVPETAETVEEDETTPEMGQTSVHTKGDRSPAVVGSGGDITVTVD